MSVAEFFTMGGYGQYVWSSIGLTILMVIVEIVILQRKNKHIVQRIIKIQRLRIAESSGGKT